MHGRDEKCVVIPARTLSLLDPSSSALIRGSEWSNWFKECRQACEKNKSLELLLKRSEEFRLSSSGYLGPVGLFQERLRDHWPRLAAGALGLAGHGDWNHFKRLALLSKGLDHLPDGILVESLGIQISRQTDILEDPARTVRILRHWSRELDPTCSPSGFILHLWPVLPAHILFHAPRRSFKEFVDICSSIPFQISNGMRVALAMEISRQVGQATPTGQVKDTLNHFGALGAFLEEGYKTEVWTRVRRLTPPNSLTDRELTHLLADLYHSLVTNRQREFESSVWRWGERLRDRDHAFACLIVDRLTGIQPSEEK